MSKVSLRASLETAVGDRGAEGLLLIDLEARVRGQCWAAPRRRVGVIGKKGLALTNRRKRSALLVTCGLREPKLRGRRCRLRFLRSRRTMWSGRHMGSSLNNNNNRNNNNNSNNNNNNNSNNSVAQNVMGITILKNALSRESAVIARSLGTRRRRVAKRRLMTSPSCGCTWQLMNLCGWLPSMMTMPRGARSLDGGVGALGPIQTWKLCWSG